MTNFLIAGDFLHLKIISLIAQHMSDEEFQRRNLTGTLMSCSVTAKTLKMLATDPNAVVNEAKVK